jgi:hypothetical protein
MVVAKQLSPLGPPPRQEPAAGMNETPRQPGKRMAGLSNRGEETATPHDGFTSQI